MTGKKGAAAAAAVALGLALAVLWPSYVDAVRDRDEGAYALVAARWSDGSLPYRDVFDHKPPLVPLLYRGAFAVRRSMVPVRLLWTALVAATALAVFGLVRRLSPGASAAAPLVAAALCAWGLSSGGVQGGTANTEVPMACLVALSALVVVAGTPPGDRLAPSLAGLLSGLALLAKPVALPEALLLAAWLARPAAPGEPRRSRAIRPLLFALGASVPALCAGAYFAARGGLGAAWEAVVVYNVRYAGGSPYPLDVRVAGIGQALAGDLLFVAAPAALLFAWRVRKESPAPLRLVLLWTAASLVGVFVAGRLYPHYFVPLVPPLACAAGLLWAEAARSGLARSTFVPPLAAGIALAVLLPSVRSTLDYRSRWAYFPGWQASAADEVRARIPSGGTLLVWGAEPEIYFRSGARPQTRYVYRYAWTGGSGFARRAREEVLAAAAATPPDAVVVVKDDAVLEAPIPSIAEWSRDAWPRLAAALGKHEVLEAPGYYLLVAPRPSR